MNRWYQNGLFANRQLSFSGRSLGKSVCYAIVLVAMSTISWIPEGGCQACAKPFDTTANAYSNCWTGLERRPRLCP